MVMPRKHGLRHLQLYILAYWISEFILIMSIVFLLPATLALNRRIPLDGSYLERNHKSCELTIHSIKPMLLGYGTSAFLSFVFLLAVLINAPHNRKNRYPYK